MKTETRRTNQWTRGAAATFIETRLESAAPASSQSFTASVKRKPNTVACLSARSAFYPKLCKGRRHAEDGNAGNRSMHASAASDFHKIKLCEPRRVISGVRLLVVSKREA